jgi:hypothetical protein
VAEKRPPASPGTYVRDNCGIIRAPVPQSPLKKAAPSKLGMGHQGATWTPLGGYVWRES